MKIRWRQHEMVLGAILALATIAGYLSGWYRLTTEQIEDAYYRSFRLAREFETVRAGRHIEHVSFNYVINILLPQIGSVLLLYAGYLWLNRFIVPAVKRLSVKENYTVSLRKIAGIILQIGVLGYLIALGVNALTWFAHPHYYNYGGFGLLALLGYNDRPLTDMFAGFDRALFILGLFGIYASIREIVIHYLERQNVRRDYRLMITNEITAIAVMYFATAFFLSALNLASSPFFAFWFKIAAPALLVFMSNIYWLLPYKGEKSWLDRKVTARLLISTFLYTFPFLISLKAEGPIPVFLIGWIAQLFLLTPVSWLVYQQRKDKILRLRGLETELVKSQAGLQFLRSQINPHFLFNALNTLYGTALLEKSERTATGIQKLGDMMRFMLHDNNQDFIPMSREIEYLNNYISLQKLRIATSHDILLEDNINAQHCNHQIAPMLLIPFVENAFKHGISLKEKSWIKIRLDCDDRHIHFEVRNSVHQRQANDTEKEKSGIGLKNVEERLKLIYPAKHQFSYSRDDHEFIARLTIQP